MCADDQSALNEKYKKNMTKQFILGIISLNVHMNETNRRERKCEKKY